MVNSEKIKKRVKEIGLSQRNVADVWGVRQSTANQKINNVRPMSLQEAEALAALLHIEDSDFRSYFFAG